jgi:hypothetical protein
MEYFKVVEGITATNRRMYDKNNYLTQKWVYFTQENEICGEYTKHEREEILYARSMVYS